MEISPQGKDAIKGKLCLFMSEDEAERFIDLEHAMDVIKQGQLCWQAPVSIGIHAAELYLSAKAEGDGAALPDLIGVSLEPLEALLQSLSAVPDEETPPDERAVTLFHTRFALGLLLLAKGKKQRAKALLHEVAGTRVSIRGREFISGPDVIRYSTDIAEAKWHTAYYLLLEGGNQQALVHVEVVFALAEAAACALWCSPLIIPIAVAFLGLWANACERADASQEFDFPDFGWLDLFTGASEVLSFCPDPDTDGDLPNECAADSPQITAWTFGQIVGTLAVRWSPNPHEKTDIFHEEFNEQDSKLFTWGQLRSYRALCTVEALLSEFDVGRNWDKARKGYVENWRRSDRWGGAVLSEMSPESDLFWAVRIGFADKILESSHQQVLLTGETSPPVTALEPLDPMRTQLQRIAFEQMKSRQDQQRIIDMLADLARAEERRRARDERDVISTQTITDLIAAGESAKVEFKSSLRWDWRRSEINKELETVVLKTIVAFLNTHGGTLLIGVDDDKQVVGIEADYKTLQRKGNRDGYHLHLMNLVSGRVGKDQCLNVEVTIETPERKDVCMVRVKHSREPAYLLEGSEGNKVSRFYMRAGNQSILLDSKESYDYIRKQWPA